MNVSGVHYWTREACKIEIEICFKLTMLHISIQTGKVLLESSIKGHNKRKTNNSPHFSFHSITIETFVADFFAIGQDARVGRSFVFLSTKTSTDNIFHFCPRPKFEHTVTTTIYSSLKGRSRSFVELNNPLLVK